VTQRTVVPQTDCDSRCGNERFGRHAELSRPRPPDCVGRYRSGRWREYLFLFFSPWEESRAAAYRYRERVNSRPNREPAVSEATIKAQVTAVIAWLQGNGAALPRLGEIKQLVLVGNNDVMVPTINSYTMAQKIKNATLIV
jgi:hypothetical protein